MTVPAIAATTATGKTASMNDVLATLRDELLSFKVDGEGGDSARDYIEERLYQNRAPDGTPKFPYGTMRLAVENDGRNHGQRLTGTLEVFVYGRPHQQWQDVNDVCDLFDQAMLCMRARTQGLMFAHGKTREPMPPSYGAAAVDGEVVTIRLTYTLAIWPAYLTKLTRVLPPITE